MKELNLTSKTLAQLIFCCVLVNYASRASTLRPISHTAHDKEHAVSQLDTTFTIIRSTSNTYGYEIRTGSRVLIKQLTIPGMPGNLGFRNKGDATKVAKLVIKKLSLGIMPPTVEQNELAQLKIKL